MEIDSLKTQLGNLLALHRDDDANQDDIVFATVDYMKKAHDVAQMLLLEGRFQELQRCLHLCQAAFGDAANVQASVVGRAGSHPPLLSFAGASTEGAEAGEERRRDDPRTSKTATTIPLHTSVAAADGAKAADGDRSDAPHLHQQQQQPFLDLHSDEDRRVFAALQSRTAQLQKQLEAAMRLRRGRDTEYYMQRLGLREKDAAPVEAKEEGVKVRPTPQVAPQPNFRATSSTTSSPAAAKRASLLPAVPPRPSRASWQAAVPPPQPAHSAPLHLPPSTSKTASTLNGATSAGTVTVPVTAPPQQLWMNAGGTSTDVTPPTPPERGVSFGNRVHFSRGKGRIELPPLVTSGRLFGVAHDNPMSVQHTVFGSSAAPHQAPGQRGGAAAAAAADDDSDFGIRAVETVYGVEASADEVPLHLRPVPGDVRLWSSSSSSSSSSSANSPSSSHGFSSPMASLKVEKPLSPPPFFAPSSDVSPTAAADGEEEVTDEGEVFSSPRTARIPSILRATRRRSSTPAYKTAPGAPSLIRPGTGTGPVAGSTKDATLLTYSQQRRRTAPEIIAIPARAMSPTWPHPAHTRKRSVEPHGISLTSNPACASSASRTLVSVAESSSTATSIAATSTTAGASSSEPLASSPSALTASPEAMKAAKAVEAARQTTQYVFSSSKAQHTRSEQALQRCDALATSRLPYSARQAAASVRASRGEDREEEVKAGLRPDSGSTLSIASPRPSSGGDWRPVSQMPTASSSTQALSSMPSLPNPFPTLAAPLPSADGQTGGDAGGSTTASIQPYGPASQYALSPAAEQQLIDIRAAYEQKLFAAASDVRVMEARWVGQHRQLLTQSSLPPLENIAEWRKRRGRWPQQQRSDHSGKDGGSGGRRQGQSRHRTHRTPPIPPPVVRAGAAVSTSTGSAAPLSRGSVRRSDTGLAASPGFTQSLSLSPSPSLLITTPSQASRRSTGNPEEGSGTFSQSSSDAAQRPPMEPFRLEPSTAAAAAAAASSQLLVTPPERQSLPITGRQSSSSVLMSAGQRLSRNSRGDSLQMLPAAPQRIQPVMDSVQESASLVCAVATCTDGVDSEGGGAAQGTPGKLVHSVDGVRRLFSCDSAAEKEGNEEADFNDEERSSSAVHDDGSQLASSPLLSDEQDGAFAGTGVYSRCGGELVKGAADSTDGQRRGDSKVAADASYTYHPAVSAIIDERRRRRETQINSLAAVPHPCATEDVLATWQRTLRVVAGDATVGQTALTHNHDWSSARALPSTSLDTVVHPGETLSFTADPWWTGRTRRSNTEVYSIPSPVLQWSPAALEPSPLHRHGIRCGAAATRDRRTQEVLSAAIRDASARVREEDLVRPAWKPAGHGSSASQPRAAAAATAAAPLSSMSCILRKPGQSPFPLHFPEVFAVGAPTVPPPAGNAGTSRGAAAVDRAPDMSLISVPSAATTRTTTPIVLSLTGKSLMPPASVQAATTSGSHDGASSTAYLTPYDLTINNGTDTRSVVSPSPDEAPLLSHVQICLAGPDGALAAQTAYHHLHAAYRISEVLRAAPDWTAVVPSVLGRCLPLCTAAVRLQRWWRQQLACRALQACQRRTHAYLLHQQRRDAAALRIQRQLRVHWAWLVVGQRRAACAAATERRVAAENPVVSSLSRTNAGSSAFTVFVELSHGPSTALTGSITSARQSHRGPHRAVSAMAGSEDRSHASFGDVHMAAAAATAAAGGARRGGSQLGGPLMSGSRSTSFERSAQMSNRQHGATAVVVTSSSDFSLVENDAQHYTLNTKDPWAAAAAAAAAAPPSIRHNDHSQPFRPRPLPPASALLHVAHYVPSTRKGTATAVEVPLVVSQAEVGPSRHLRVSSTSVDDSGSNDSGNNKTVSPEVESPDMKQSQSVASMENTPNSMSTASEQQDADSAALRLQQWYRRCSAEETAQLQREVEVLTAVVTRRAPLTAVRDALRNADVHRRDEEGDSPAEGAAAAAATTNSSSGSSSNNAEDASDITSARALAATGDWDTTPETAAIRALSAKCTGDVYQAYLQRAAAARQQGDYKTPLERVNLRALQRIRQKREDEENQKRLLLEQQQRLRQQQQQRRERQMMDAAKLVQRVGRGFRWRRWLRERQCKELHYRATHTLDLLSQTDTLGTLALVDGRHQKTAAGHFRAGLSSISAEEQRVYLAGGPKVTTHVMAQLRATYPEWFGLNVDRESAAWVACNATPAQLAAIVTVQSFVFAFGSRTVTFGHYHDACARSIQLAWRLHQRRRRARSERRKRNSQAILKS
ncbi:hypothetical protein ABB37_08748 [Leptomonas pyrrhocoris]|uniref:Uncharacterized protein n=1 Tax=Leptomonas pyrrhocoris TaxID=157538 RepID=A0A0M9FSJ8_LEPPY|nr:hypothetical protein ABB37_08748 [Leptomonas pyrrhocoris]KPA75069.1 hypothetical protein ABB37_08748 [Leptomonas pyrrhocoris]|eukprot:XP_015653508.1 hypothetical protein ABB37_08748 [Leptomonas pyrrhocoris]